MVLNTKTPDKTGSFKSTYASRGEGSLMHTSVDACPFQGDVLVSFFAFILARRGDSSRVGFGQECISAAGLVNELKYGIQATALLAALC